MSNDHIPRRTYPTTPRDHLAVQSVIHGFARDALEYISAVSLPNDSTAKLQYLQKQANIGLRKLPPDYEEYLDSETWKHVRCDILSFYGWKCAVCFDDKDLHIHHRNYGNWRSETRTDCLPLCLRCHAFVHINGLLPIRWFRKEYAWIQRLLYSNLVKVRRLGVPFAAAEICDQADTIGNLSERYF